MESKKEALYFIAVLPPAALAASIEQLKVLVSERYGSKAALRSPAHITLQPPFRMSEDVLGHLDNFLMSFSKGHEAFPLTLNGFDCFRPRVIFIDIVRNEELAALQSELSYSLEKHFSLVRDTRPYHPHLTIAFKDLHKKAFYEALEYFAPRSFEAKFMVSAVTLLQHDGQRWQVKRSYTLAVSDHMG